VRRTAELRHTLIGLQTVEIEARVRAAALRPESEYGKELMERATSCSGLS
jgi:hypothetical protein